MAMIELTREQSHILQTDQESVPEFVDPQTRRLYVLLSIEEYQRLVRERHEEGAWTDDDRDLLRAEACDMLDSFGKSL